MSWLDPTASPVDPRTERALESAGRRIGVIPVYKEITSNHSITSTTDQDITGLTVTISLNARRRIKITAYGILQKITNAGRGDIVIKEGTTQLEQWNSPNMAISETGSFYVAVYETPSKGNHTYKLAGRRDTAGMTVLASGTFPAWIAVEDVGPSE